MHLVSLKDGKMSHSEVMERDAKTMRGDRPFLFTDLRSGQGVDQVVRWVRDSVLLEGM